MRKLGCSRRDSMRDALREGGSQAGAAGRGSSEVIYKRQCFNIQPANPNPIVIFSNPYQINSLTLPSTPLDPHSEYNKVQQNSISKLQIRYKAAMTSIRIYISQMAKRLEVLSRSINSQHKYVDSSFDYLLFDTFLTPEENTIRKNLRNFLEREIKDAIIPFIQKSTFPEPLIAKIRESKITQYFFKPPYGKATSLFFQGVLMSELARIDAGLATFFIVQAGLLGCTIQSLGSQAQKAKYLPKIINLEWIGAWGLTEDKIGSDATNIQTTVTKNSEGYSLNGVKRWMGNGNKDLLIVWAKNEHRLVEGFILQTHNNPQGWKSQVIKNKFGLRIVQNCNITLNNVQVKQEHKLPFATDFQTGTNKILKHSRPLVCWIAVGVCIGVYDNAIRYTRERKQFGKSIANFQLVQEKLVRIMSNIQAMLLLAWRICNLYDSNKAEMGQIALAKAWITERARDVCKLGREICGGNGLLHQNYVMRAMTDIEAIYTYEGSYQVNALVAGRDLTGFSAFVK